MLGKTQHEVENEYYFVDLPELLMLKDQIRASELLENIDVATFPHLSEQKDREAILKRISSVLPAPLAEPQKSAKDQYEELKLRLKGR